MSGPAALVLVTTSYPRWANGREAAGSFVADLAAELSRQVPVRVVAPGDRRALEQPASNLRVYRYPAPRRRLVNLRYWNPLDALRIAMTLRAGRAAVARALADGAAGHVLALWALPPGAWARSAGRKRRVPYSVWLLGSDVWSLGRLPVVRGILRRVIRGAVRRYADGLQLARDGEAIGGVPVAFLPTTRALSICKPAPPAPAPPYRMVFIGRWHPNKGVDLLLDALALLDDADWQLLTEVAIYGGGPLHPLVNERVQALRAAGRPVTLGGFIPKPEAERAVLRADWLVIPSRIESIPVIFSDAMKLARPVVAMPVGDLSQLVSDPACGICAQTVSAPALAAALREALHTPATSFAEGIAAQAVRFDLPSIAAQIIAGLSSHD